MSSPIGAVAPRADAARGVWRAAFAIAATMGFVGGAYAGYFVLEGDGGVTYAAANLFRAERPEFVDLKTNGQDSVEGVIQGNLAPGDHVEGVVYLSGNTLLFDEPYDLDIDLEYAAFLREGAHPPEGSGPPLPQLLQFTEMTYGLDDLLAPPGRDLVTEIDANPLLGDGDGRLSLEEFRAGVNDLEPPGPDDSPTPYLLAIQLGDGAGNWAMNRGLDVTFTFHLAGVQEADLN